MAALAVLAAIEPGQMADAAADVTDQGSFGTSITIQVPPFRGIEPSITLSYDSSAGNGVVGVGWRLDASSYVTRAGRTGGPPRFDGSDRYLLDGADLDPCAPACPLGGTHETRQRTFQRVTFDGERWTRWSGDGVRFEYEPLPLAAGPKGIYRWALARTIDPHGNAVNYSHGCEPTECYLDSITYASDARVSFFYEPRADSTSYATGAEPEDPAAIAETAKRLKTIAVEFGGGFVRAYALAYVTSVASGASLLRSAQLFGSDASVGPGGQVTAGATPPTPASSFSAEAMSGPPGGVKTRTLPMSGLLEIGYPGPGEPVYKPVYDNAKIEFEPGSESPGGSVTGDWDGDGRLDVAVYTVTFPQGGDVVIRSLLAHRSDDTPQPTNLGVLGRPAWSDMTASVRDVNADQRDDLLLAGRDPDTGKPWGGNRVAISKGDGTFALLAQAPASASSTWKGLDTSGIRGPVAAAAATGAVDCRVWGDLNADGLTDRACTYTTGAGTPELHLALAQPDGTVQWVSPALPPVVTDLLRVEIALGDVDADGDADVLLAVRIPGDTATAGTWQLVTGVSNGDGISQWLTSAPGWTWGPPSQAGTTYRWSLVAGDVDGNGRADYTLTQISRVKNENLPGDLIRVATSIKGRTELVAQPTVQTEATGVEIGDYDGNGLDDILTETPPGVARANGQGGFDAWEPLRDLSEQSCSWRGDVNGDGRFDRLCVLREHEGTKVWYRYRDELTPNAPSPPWGWMSADVTGNGLADLVRVHYRNPGVEVYTLRAQANGGYVRSQQTIDPGEQMDNPDTAAWMPLDVGGPRGDGDGRADLVLVDGGPRPRVYTLLSTDSGWQARVDRIDDFAGSDPGAWVAGAVNADGRGDLVRVRRLGNGAVSVEALLSNGDGSWTERSEKHFESPVRPQAVPREFMPLDVNGDGLTDLLQADPWASPARIRWLVSSGDGTWAEREAPLAGLTAANVRDLRPMEINGDGLSDLAMIRPAKPPPQDEPPEVCLSVSAYLSTGSGWKPGSVDLPAAPNCPAGADDTRNLHTTDFDADGDDDIISLSTWRAPAPYNDTRTAVHVLVNHPGQEWTAIDERALSPAHPRTWAYFTTDTDHDGHNEWAYAGADLGLLDFTTRSDLLTGTANGDGASTRIDYRRLAAHRVYLPSGSLPNVVDSVTITDAAHDPPITQHTAWNYDGARWSDARRRMLGFERIRQTTRRAVVESRSRLTNACGAQAEAIALRNTDETTYKLTELELEPPGEAPPYLCRTKAVTETEMEGAQETFHRTDYEHDGYGNVVTQTESATAAPRRRTVSSFAPNVSGYIVALPARQRVEYAADATWKLASATENIYDSNTAWDQSVGARGDLRRVRRWYDARRPRFVETAYEYDARGNLTKTTSPTGVVETTTPDPVHELFPIRRCNPVGCTEQTWHPRFGAPQTDTDLNGRVTTYEYDTFGRRIGVINPDGSTTTTKYLSQGSWTGPPSQRRRIRTERSDDSPGDNVLWREEWLDGLGRSYRTVVEGGLETETRYDDASHRPAATSTAHLSSERPTWTRYEYDAIDRPVTMTLPGNRISRTDYKAGATITRDQVGRMTTGIRDGYGRTIKVEQTDRAPCRRCPPKTTTNYSYDALDRRTRIVDGAGHVTTTIWDSLGRIVRTRDPDGGPRNWTWRDDDSIASSTDAVGQVITWQYDQAGRQIERLERRADRVLARRVRWTWDRDARTNQTHGDSIGRIVRSSYEAPLASGSTDSYYDNIGRVNRTRQCIAGSCAEIGLTFDRAGRLKTLAYPDAAGNVSPTSEQLVHHYDDTGRLQGLTGQGQVRYAHLVYNARDQLDTLSHNDGTKDRLSYDADTHLLDRIRVAPARSGNSLLDARYTHYDDGRVATIKQSRPSALLQSYAYDDHARLTGVDASVARRNRDYTYDSAGRMASSTTTGRFNYADRGHVHAPTSTTRGHRREYDANGQLISLRDPGRRSLALTWSVNGHPQRISNRGTGRTTLFGYDAGDSRVLKRQRGGKPYLYFGPYVERDRAGRWVRNYYAGGRVVARRDGAGKLTSIHGDHLGSTRVTTTASGRVSGRYDYDPFGKLLPGTASRRDQRLYSGTPFDDETGLSYMSARYYDAELAHFISRDSLIPDAYRPQSLDRYAYVENEPINSIDPNGHLPRRSPLSGVFGVGSPRNTMCSNVFVTCIFNGAGRTVTEAYGFDPRTGEYQKRSWYSGALVDGEWDFGYGPIIEVLGRVTSDPSEWAQWTPESISSPPLVEATGDPNEWGTWPGETTITPPPLVAAKTARQVWIATFNDGLEITAGAGGTGTTLEEDRDDVRRAMARMEPELAKSEREAKSAWISALPGLGELTRVGKYVTGNVLGAIYDIATGEPLGAAENLGNEGLEQSLTGLLGDVAGSVFWFKDAYDLHTKTMEHGENVNRYEALRLREYRLSVQLGDDKARLDFLGWKQQYMGPGGNAYDTATGRPINRIQGR
jgi:RHS repeat-associated protein